MTCVSDNLQEQSRAMLPALIAKTKVKHKRQPYKVSTGAVRVEPAQVSFHCLLWDQTLPPYSCLRPGVSQPLSLRAKQKIYKNKLIQLWLLQYLYIYKYTITIINSYIPLCLCPFESCPHTLSLTKSGVIKRTKRLRYSFSSVGFQIFRNRKG